MVQQIFVFKILVNIGLYFHLSLTTKCHIPYIYLFYLANPGKAGGFSTKIDETQYFSNHLPQLCLRHCQAQTVRDTTTNPKIEFVGQL